VGSTSKRLFNVSINGTAVLTNFDTYAAAGAKNKAVVREFTTTSNSSGQIVVQFTNVTDNASISGIEILK
jgi:beta-galactosidase